MAITGITNLTSLTLSGDLIVAGTTTSTGGQTITCSLVVGLAASIGSGIVITGQMGIGGTTVVSVNSMINVGNCMTAVSQISLFFGAASTLGTTQCLGIATGNGFGWAGTGTTAVVGGFQTGTVANTGGGTVTRTFGFKSGISTTGSTGNACFTDSAAYTGDFFLYQAGTQTNFLTGPLSLADTGAMTIGTTLVTTIGSAGTAAAVLTPAKYLPILAGTVSYKIALLNP